VCQAGSAAGGTVGGRRKGRRKEEGKEEGRRKKEEGRRKKGTSQPTAQQERRGVDCGVLCVRQRRRARDEEGARLEKEGWRRREARKGWYSGVQREREGVVV